MVDAAAAAMNVQILLFELLSFASVSAYASATVAIACPMTVIISIAGFFSPDSALPTLPIAL
jgi:hypothetical protein